MSVSKRVACSPVAACQGKLMNAITTYPYTDYSEVPDIALGNLSQSRSTTGKLRKKWLTTLGKVNLRQSKVPFQEKKSI